MRFCHLLTRYRERANLTKTELARKLGLKTASYIIDLEAGRKKPPTIERCKQLAHTLSLSKKESEEFLQEAAKERLPSEEVSLLGERPSLPPEAILAKSLISVPILGNAPAGPKSFVQDELQEWVSLPKELAKGKRLYLLRVTGDSMNQGGIKKGSMVIVDADAQPENGDIVVIRIDGETTIKRFKKYDSVVVLIPESSNHTHKEQTYTNKNDIQLRGVVKGVWWT